MRPDDRRYQTSHEWAKLEGDVVVVGISDFAVEALTDLVFVDLPAEGDEVTAGEPFGEVESVKAVSELYAPVSGAVAAVNESLEDDLDQLGKDPFGAGWMIKITPTDVSQLDALLDAAGYEKVIAESA